MIGQLAYWVVCWTDKSSSGRHREDQGIAFHMKKLKGMVLLHVNIQVNGLGGSLWIRIRGNKKYDIVVGMYYKHPTDVTK